MCPKNGQTVERELAPLSRTKLVEMLEWYKFDKLATAAIETAIMLIDAQKAREAVYELHGSDEQGVAAILSTGDPRIGPPRDSLSRAEHERVEAVARKSLLEGVRVVGARTDRAECGRSDQGGYLCP